MLHRIDIELICSVGHGDPFSVLGPHLEEDDSLSLRVFLPGAMAVSVLDADATELLDTLVQRHPDGFFEATVPALAAFGADAAARGGHGIAYRLQVSEADGSVSIVEDPYRFPPALSDTDVWLLGAGSHLRPFEALGATPMVLEQVAGTRFAVWAANAMRVSVVGDFNRWDGRRHAMRLHHGCGVWEIFIPGVAPGALYKYEIRSAAGVVLPLKPDPFALQCEVPPGSASIVAKLPARVQGSAERRRANAGDAPVSIYQVHPGTWRLRRDGTLPSWDDLAASLLPYVVNVGFTHVELLAMHEHDDTADAAACALYATAPRHGEAPAFRRFVERCHAQGVGVILDWRATDVEDTEMRNFALGSALYWLERHAVDGLRLDAEVSPPDSADAGAANALASAFLTRLNQVVHAERPQALMVAGASPRVPCIARAARSGGFGFNLEIDAGWAEDSLRFIEREPARTFAGQRAYLGFVFGHLGKKLVLMGNEFAHGAVDRPSLDWALLADRRHEGVQRLCHDLNHLYTASPALFERDADPAGFEWVAQDAEHGVIAFLRRGKADTALMLVVCNFSGAALPGYRVGVPHAGTYRQCLDTDSAHYAGSDLGTGFAVAPAETLPWHGRPYSLALTLPAQATVMIEWTS